MKGGRSISSEHPRYERVRARPRAEPVRSRRGEENEKRKVLDEEAERYDIGGNSKGVWIKELRGGRPGMPWGTNEARGG